MNLNLLAVFIFFVNCTYTNVQTISEKEEQTPNTQYIVDSSKSTIIGRFTAPEGFTITTSEKTTFGNYLQNLPLKPMGTEVKYYDGGTKPNNDIYCSVVDMDIDPVDLQQCADAVMRLRGEHLFEQKRFDEIKFNFLSDGKPRYFNDYANGDYSYSKFRKYMKYIFSYANTGSMCNELKSRPFSEMQIGDVFVQKGRPYGHAVIVVNMATDTLGNKAFMIAQSYMPAQETQILLNPKVEENSPWYTLAPGEISTPEWIFNSTDLKHF
jgi:hypothetical protein